MLRCWFWPPTTEAKVIQNRKKVDQKATSKSKYVFRCIFLRLGLKNEILDASTDAKPSVIRGSNVWSLFCRRCRFGIDFGARRFRSGHHLGSFSMPKMRKSHPETVSEKRCSFLSTFWWIWDHFDLQNGMPFRAGDPLFRMFFAGWTNLQKT